MHLRTVKVEKPEGMNIIMGQSRVIRTVDEIHEVLVDTIPGIRFGVAFNQGAESPAVKFAGTDDGLVELAKRNAATIGADHLFVLLTQDVFPVRVMQSLKGISDISEIYCATDNAIEVIVVDSERGRGVMGLVDDHTVARDEDNDALEPEAGFFHKLGQRFFKSTPRSRVKLA
ncbi:MAG TPA: adenosine-specific kinase [bacterium]